MRFCRGIVNWPDDIPATVAAIGNFDGLHKGHQKLLVKLKRQSNALNMPSVVILFEPHPKEFFLQQKSPARLLSLREKLELLQQSGIDFVLCLHFDEYLASVPAKEFIESILVHQLKIKKLIVGKDFVFGHQRQGDVDFLKKQGAQWGFSVDVISDCMSQRSKVSSTRIRSAIMSGDFSQAERWLQRPYSISGKVVYGMQRGRQLGFPTANLALKRRVSPVQGVYAVRVVLPNGERKQGVANVGTRPTFTREHCWLEVHLFDWHQSLYGQWLSVEFIEKIRDEQRFSSVTELSAQIQQDVLEAKAILHRQPTRRWANIMRRIG